MPHKPVRQLVAALLLMTTVSVSAGEVSLGVAANFTDTTRELIQAFEASTGHTASASFGSTGKLYAQIRNGAPYHVFMAADVQRPERIEQEGVGVPGTRFTYAQGKLVLWSPEPETFDSPQDYLADGDFQRLAIANPKTAPYGLAAQQVLQALELWQPLQPRLVRGDSIAQAFQFVATGNAKAGFVALSQVRAWPEQEGRAWQVPQRLYQPIEQQAILLRQGEDNAAARAWLGFLQTETARDIIRRFGYDIPD
ncbi:molybdate ABC transporter substrate-binding protein [Marinobacter oulmenensis]|uniref:Molybdate transport system substrate-binding protein n=1 Tax=Marinobacter oulmenensis TaxID=643747 RepID=A0A840U240_9GAMM|nr:molybdate ABC transporter substrate-binding protein [Marinobacter oulmenensis]MBB5319744.1 molybdate transport system substrate-binding protein [Marinobacter oulmenensis]